MASGSLLRIIEAQKCLVKTCASRVHRKHYLIQDFPQTMVTEPFPGTNEVPPYEDGAKVYRTFFLRVNSSAFVGLTDCINKRNKGEASSDQSLHAI